jgi:hypothetical protein
MTQVSKWHLSAWFSGQRWIYPRQRIFLFIIIFIFFNVLIIPKALVIYYETKAARLIDAALVSSTEYTPNSVICMLEPLTNTAARSKLESAELTLKKATRYNPKASHPYLLLGGVYCLTDQSERAVQAFQEYNRLRPANPLSQLELSFIYLKLCTDHQSGSIPKKGSSPLCSDITTYKELVNEWLPDEASLDNLYILGDQAFGNRQFRDAVLWYQWSYRVNGQLPTSSKFGWKIASLISESPLPKNLDTKSFPENRITDFIQIEGETLRWINPELGKLVEAYPVGDVVAGGLWWSGCAGTLVDIEKKGRFEMTFRILDEYPPPIQIRIEDNFEPIKSFSLIQSDSRWKEPTIPHTFEKGYHLISICFLNDGNENGIDRNALVDWIRIRKDLNW